MAYIGQGPGIVVTNVNAVGAQTTATLALANPTSLTITGGGANALRGLPEPTGLSTQEDYNIYIYNALSTPFASVPVGATPPAGTPVQGELYYDTSDGTLKVYDTNVYVSTQSGLASSVATISGTVDSLSANSYAISGGTISGSVAIVETTKTTAGALNITTASTDTDDFALKINNADGTYVQIFGDQRVEFLSKLISDPASGPNFVSNTVQGFAIKGPVPGDAAISGTVLDVFYNPGAIGTAINYRGLIANPNNLINKGYVDDNFLPLTAGAGKPLTGELVINVNSGNIISGNSGVFAVDDLGRVTCRNISTVNGDASFDNEVYLSSSAAVQSIRAFNNASKIFALQVSNGTNTVSPSGNNFTTIFQATTSALTVGSLNFVKLRGENGDQDFEIQGRTTASTTITTGQLLFVNRNGSANADAINYNGLVNNDENIQTKASVLDLIANNAPDTVVSLTVTNNIQGASGGQPGQLNIDADVVDVASRLTLPTYVNATTSSTVNLGIGTTKAFYIQSNASAGFNSGTIGYFNNGGLVWNRPLQLFGNSVAGSDDPLANGQQQTLNFGGDGPLGYIYKNGNTQTGSAAGNGIRIAIDNAQGQPQKVMNLFINSSNQGYMNLYYAPQNAYGIVRLQDLATGVVGSINGYSTTGEEGTDNYQFVANTHLIPGQCEFGEKTSGGRGFTLQGSTISQPSNTSAIVLQLFHYTSSQAQASKLLYAGDTTTEDECVQTKASTNALIASALANQSDPDQFFINHGSAGSTTTLTGFGLVCYFEKVGNLASISLKAGSDANIGVNAKICQLPSGYRPLYQSYFTAANDSGSVQAVMRINTNGQITVVSVTGPTSTLYANYTFNVSSFAGASIVNA
jgi:hypothetical protein